MRSMGAELIESMLTLCTRLSPGSEPDGQGGFVPAWSEDGTFYAAVVKKKTDERRTAERPEAREIYSVTVPEDVQLRYHDVFRREADGAVFRAIGTTEDGKPPEAASFRFARTAAERWELA